VCDQPFGEIFFFVKISLTIDGKKFFSRSGKFFILAADSAPLRNINFFHVVEVVFI
jgi:hypothetical protein